jgi:hypothetical protein
MKTIRELRILPPFAIGRLGGASEPLDNYTVADDPAHPLNFRRIVGAETLIVDEKTGEIRKSRVPDKVEFKQDGHIKPVAPFLEVFALTGRDKMEPLTLELLRAQGLGPAAVSWRVTVANRKVVRRTEQAADLVFARTPWFSGHDPRTLEGHCKNFIKPDKFIDFGRVRYIKPNAAFPGIRLRFTPAKGLIYGPNVKTADPAIPSERAIYNATKRKGNWYHFEVPVGIDNEDPDYKGKFVNETLPPSLFAIVPPAPPWLHGNVAVSRGYLDDACDGFVEVRLTLKDGTKLQAKARISSGPPTVVPDSMFVRTLADDLDQALHGPHVPVNEPPDVTHARAEDIIRRAYETVRFLNVAMMNGNSMQGRPPLSLDTMPAEEAFDTERLERPVMASKSVDTLAVLALHQQVYAALRGGAAPWFVRLLRQPDEAADYTDAGRRKMPALMCGADNNYLALTWRQIDTIRAAALPKRDAENVATAAEARSSILTPRNLSAQLHYVAAGNPINSRPEMAIGNCCPGLELDFRAVWRRLFDGLVLREYDNLIVDVERQGLKSLKGHRLLRVNGIKVMTQKLGPSPADPNDSVVLSTNDDPEAVQPLEWSNALAHILWNHVGKQVTCDFSTGEAWLDQVWWDDENPPKHITRKLKVLPFFEGQTAVISTTLAGAGELTQGLCSPWQNDYRECSCYYWASARPDYVNVEPSQSGTSAGDNWLQKKRTGDYIPDDYVDTRMVLYDDLFLQWEKWLRIQIGGRDMAGDGGDETS